jgi:pyrimidine-nucleoside phosphorylase
MLGAGRQKKEDQIDPTAGILLHKKVGDTVEAGDPLATLLTSRDADLDSIQATVQAAFQIGADQPGEKSGVLSL